MNLIKTKNFELACNIKGDETAQKLALVLPGRLDTKDYPHLKSHVEFLASRGFFAISFDPPGTWESPGDISLYTMTNYLKTINELIESFGNRPTFVLGHSRGGSLAALAALENQHVTHFVSVMGNYSYAPSLYDSRGSSETWKTQGYLVEKRDDPKNPLQNRLYHLPYAFLEDSHKYDLSQGLSHCLKPKLFIYGTQDITVKPETMKKSYELSAEPKEIASIDSDHNYRLRPHFIQAVNELVGKFLDKHPN